MSAENGEYWTRAHPEHVVLDIGEDMWVNHRWRELGMDVRFAPDAVVRWDLRPDLATKDVPLPYDARHAADIQDLVDILAQGAKSRELMDDVTVLALRRL